MPADKNSVTTPWARRLVALAVAAALTVTGLAMFVGTHPAGRSPSMATTAHM